MPEAWPGSRAALRFHCIMQMRVSKQTGNGWRSSLQVSPLTLTWTMGTLSSSKMRPRRLELSVCNWKLVLKAWSGRQCITEARRTSGAQLSILQGLVKAEHWATTAAWIHFQIRTESYFTAAPGDQRRLSCKTACQNAGNFLHLLIPLLFTLLHLALATTAMLILRYWWLIMLITALGFLSAVL